MKLSKRLKALLEKKGSTLTQKQKVARALIRGHKVSPLGALYRFSSLRLAAIIFELRYEWRMNVKTTMTEVKTKYGWARVAIYSYERKRK